MPLHFSPQTKRVFHLSLPIFAELLLQLLVGNMDQFMIAHFGSAAVASIGNGNQVMNVVIIVLTTMSTAATILLTQHIGAGRVGKECSEIVTVAVTVSAVFSFLVGLFLLLEPELVFQLLRTPEDAFDGACLYTRIVGGTVLLQGLYIQLCAVLRSYTLLKEVVVLSVSMNLLNVAGNAILINGFFGFPQMGVAGAAVSTVISKAVGLTLACITLKRKCTVRFSLQYLHPFPAKTFRALLGIALGAQIVVGTAAMLFMLFAGHGFDYKSMEPAALGKLMAALYFCSMSITLAGILYYRRARGGSGPWARFSARGLNPALLLWAFVLMFAVGVVLEPLLRLMPKAATPSRGRPTPVIRKPRTAAHMFRPATCPI